MLPNFNLFGLAPRWRLRCLKKLAESTKTPTPRELKQMIALLDATESNAKHWPFVWPTDWYRQLAMSDSFTAHNVCCTSDINGYTQAFVNEIALYALKAEDFSLLEWFSKRLDAKKVPYTFWLLLKDTEPIVQFNFLTKMRHLDELVGAEREPVLAILAASEPHYWMYDYSSWYAALSKKWNIVPPLHWWNILYTLDLRRPPNAVRLLVKHYRGSTVTTRLQLTGQCQSYTVDMLENHRNEVLSQDPWAVVRSAFYGDTSIWPPIPDADAQTIAMYVDALAILMHYYPTKLKTDFYEKVPTFVRDGIPRAEFTMLLGLSSGLEAFDVFSSCIRHNSGQLTPEEGELELSLTNLL